MDPNVQRYLMNAEAASERGDYYQAISHLNKASKLQDLPEVYYERGLAYIGLDKFAQAESDLEEAFQRSTSFSTTFQILKARSEARKRLKRFQDALSDLEYLKSRLEEGNQLREVDSLIQDIHSLGEKQKEKEDFVQLYRDFLSVRPGDVWFIVSCDWMDQWVGYIGISSTFEDLPFLSPRKNYYSRPGAIDNIDIIDLTRSKKVLADPEYETSGVVLKNGLIENVNYVLLPEKAYEVLFTRYGCKNPIKRYAIEECDSIYRIEVYLKNLQLAFPVSVFAVHNFQVSRKSSVADLKQKFLLAKKQEMHVRVWKINLNIMPIERLSFVSVTQNSVYLEGGSLVDEKLLVDDAEINHDDLILLEPMRNTGFLYSENKKLIFERCRFCQKEGKLKNMCRKCHIAKYCSDSCRKRDLVSHKKSCKKPATSSLFKCFCMANDSCSESDAETDKSPMKKVSLKSRFGITGLQNLGNTCFLNSAIQCLSHTEGLTEYFLSSSYQQDINKTNPLGTKGRLAYTYCELLDHLWNGESSSIAPWKLKKTLAQIAPQFIGYQQHDAHELMSYLLDGLHEDLNRVKHKPYFEDDSEFKGKSNEEVALINWNRHIARNQSIVVELMHGQYKSTIYCPQCKNYSYAFDPFSSLSLPIPQKRQIAVDTYYIYEDPQNLPCKFSCEGLFKTVGDLKAEISKNFNFQNLLLASVYNNSIKGFLEEDMPIDKATNYVVFAYGVKDLTEKLIVQVQVSKENSSKLCAYPRIVILHKDSTMEDLHYKVIEKFKPFIIQEDLEGLRYTLVYKTVDSCLMCGDKECRGCTIPSCNRELGESCTVILNWERNSFKSAINIRNMNKCTEEKMRAVKGKKPNEPIHIDECFRHFSLPEQLDKSNAWFCSYCKDHVEANKKIEIYKVPSILIVHLKRFKSHGFLREKLTDPVIFPTNALDISEFVIGPEKPPIYDLYAISNHFGSLGGGHYTASCYNKNKGHWVEFNDSSISETDSISASSAYMLFYTARS